MAEKQDERAVRLWAGAEGFRSGYEIAPIHHEERETAMATVRARIAPDLFKRAWAEGSRLARDRQAFLALVLEAV